MAETTHDDSASEATATPPSRSTRRKRDANPPQDEPAAQADASEAAAGATMTGGEDTVQRAKETLDVAAQWAGGWMRGAVDRVRGEAVHIWDEARDVRASWHES
jgi:hypothetical protein